MNQFTEFLTSLGETFESFRDLSNSDPITQEHLSRCAVNLKHLLHNHEQVKLRLANTTWTVNDVTCEADYLESRTQVLRDLFEQLDLNELRFSEGADEQAISDILEISLLMNADAASLDSVAESLQSLACVDVSFKGKDTNRAPSLDELLDVVMESSSFDVLPELSSGGGSLLPFPDDPLTSAPLDISSLLSSSNDAPKNSGNAQVLDEISFLPLPKKSPQEAALKEGAITQRVGSSVDDYPLSFDTTFPNEDLEASEPTLREREPFEEQNLQDARDTFSSDPPEGVDQEGAHVPEEQALQDAKDTFSSNPPEEVEHVDVSASEEQNEKLEKGTAPHIAGLTSPQSLLSEPDLLVTSEEVNRGGAAFATVSFGEDIAAKLLANSVFSTDDASTTQTSPAESAPLEDALSESQPTMVEADESAAFDLAMNTELSPDKTLSSGDVGLVDSLEDSDEDDVPFDTPGVEKEETAPAKKSGDVFQTQDQELEDEDKPAVPVALQTLGGEVEVVASPEVSATKESATDTDGEQQPFVRASAAAVATGGGGSYSGALHELPGFLTSLFQTQHKVSGRIRNGEWRANQASTRPDVVRDATYVQQKILDALSLHSELSQQEQVIPAVMEHLLSLDVELLLLHLQALKEIGKESANWRRSLLLFLSEERLHQLQEHLYHRWLRTVEPEAADTFTVLLQETIDAMFRQEWDHRLVPLTHQIKKDQNKATEQTKARLLKVLQHVAQPQNLSRLFHRSRRKRDSSAFQLLVILNQESLVFGFQQMDSAKSALHRQGWVDALTSLCQQTSPDVLIPTLQAVLKDLGSFSLSTQQFVFFLSQQFIADDLEEYLCECLPYAKAENVREFLLQQAMVLDSRRLRKLLLHLLDHGVLAHTPQQEEWVLRYLQRVGRVEPVPFLLHRVFQTELEVGIRCNAVWMIASFSPDLSFPILQSVLCSEPPEGDAPGNWEAVRFLALFSLSRLPIQEVDVLLQQGKRSSSLLHQMASRQILREAIPADFKQLYDNP
ncbi:MAG: hypothetical protein EP343_02640 [Deltaproteobacteria bacterium]|nr:MAG: hypothetical protein EP343_02640 [Deltaproteobacteria bacterium]